MSSIFVQIASYDDKELLKTVQDCLDKSSGENDIYFGIHECYINNKTIFNNSNIKIQYSKAPENLGVGMGRYLANKLYDNQDYYLQIDSHSRFRENWDSIIIENLEKNLSIGNRCILTGYPPSYLYKKDGSEVLDLSADTTGIRFKRNQEESYLFENSRLINQEGSPFDSSYCSESVSAGFIFGKGEIHKVVQHPAIFYFGEEILRAASFYTNGYNLMYPNIPVVFHLYGVDSDRVVCWITFPDECNKLEEFSKYTIKTIFTENKINNISLGSQRTLKEYGTYVGLDFEKGILLEESNINV